MYRCQVIGNHGILQLNQFTELGFGKNRKETVRTEGPLIAKNLCLEDSGVNNSVHNLNDPNLSKNVTVPYLSTEQTRTLVFLVRYF